MTLTHDDTPTHHNYVIPHIYATTITDHDCTYATLEYPNYTLTTAGTSPNGLLRIEDDDGEHTAFITPEDAITLAKALLTYADYTRKDPNR